jgi:predicted RNA binding protein YcfA (HicA-like mRNA interferase family)
MSPKPRRLSGRDVVRVLAGFGFVVVATRGSHAKLRRRSADGDAILTVPLHRELAHGTIRAIYRQACRFIEAGELRPLLFSD